MNSPFVYNPLTISVLEKLRNSIFEIPKFSCLNISNWNTIIAKPINLGIIRKLIKYCFKKVLKVPFTLTVFEILLFECKSVLLPAQRYTERGKGLRITAQ